VDMESSNFSEAQIIEIRKIIAKETEKQIDTSYESGYHTIGLGPTQAAAGNHLHKNQDVTLGTLQFTTAIRLSVGANLNDITKSGFYNGDQLVNAVSSAWFYYICILHSSNPTAYQVQIAIPLTATGAIYKRMKLNSTWQAWETFNVN
jgi:hypothetical protein